MKRDPIEIRLEELEKKVEDLQGDIEFYRHLLWKVEWSVGSLYGHIAQLEEEQGELAEKVDIC